MSDPAPSAILYPVLRYADPAAAIDWLCRAFGFERMAAYDEGGSIVHAELRLGTGVLMLGPAKDDFMGMRTPREAGAITGSIYAYVPDVQAHYEQARAVGAEIVQEPRRMEYGATEYSCRDPEGNLWSFGSYRV